MSLRGTKSRGNPSVCHSELDSESIKIQISYSWLSKSFKVFAAAVSSLSLKALRFCVRMKKLRNEVYMDPEKAYSIS